MQSKAKTVAEYLKSLPEDRRKAISEARKVIRKNLPEGFEETMGYGMISYVVPLSLYPKGYLGRKDEPLPYASLASQKNHMALYLMCVYGHKKTREWFEKAFKASRKKLDMGKSCVRFKKLEDLPLDVIGKVIGRISVSDYIKTVEKLLEKRK